MSAKLFIDLSVLLFEMIGYGVLVFVDWRIAVGVFALHWAINIKIRAKNV